MPRIGLTSSQAHAPDGSIDPDLMPYVRAVERAGGEPVLLANESAHLDAVVASVTGVVLTGGVDVDPQRYGGRTDAPHSQTGRYRHDRDEFEIALVRATRDRGVPTLCICRGLQIANVAFGGTLVEDVRDELQAAYTINHRQTHENGQDRSDYAPGHELRVAPESAFARLVSATSFTTNSMHHQAIRVAGDGLAAVAHTADGVIEAVDATFDHPYFFAVQWHPEELLEDAVSHTLFNGLIRSARAR